jgi:glycosyltransferase involved in cell wall biosynthesis
MSRLRVALFCEQLLQPIPGGIGTYVRALLDGLPGTGLEVVPVSAWHPTGRLREVGLQRARRLPLPRPLLYEVWNHWDFAAIGGTEDLVHAPSLAFPQPDGRPLVVTIHDVLFLKHPSAYPPRGVRFHRRALARLRRADLAICPSSATRDDLLSSGAAPRSVRVVPLGTDLAAPPDTERRLGDLGVERPYVLWVGTMEPRKNVRGVVAGFMKAVTSLTYRDRFHLYLVGPRGWGHSDAGADPDGRVRWLGQQPRDDLAALYAGAAAFVYPSLGEGFGLPVLEAMACGAPVVTSNRSSLPEITGEAAVLCDPTDAASIAHALAEVLADPNTADDLRRHGLRRAAEFTWERSVRETADCYRALSGRPSDRPTTGSA